MKKKVCDDIVADLSAFFRPNIMTGSSIEMYTMLLLMSVLYVKIRKSSIICVAETSSKFAVD